MELPNKEKCFKLSQNPADPSGHGSYEKALHPVCHGNDAPCCPELMSIHGFAPSGCIVRGHPGFDHALLPH
jgi:hypothetical protein